MQLNEYLDAVRRRWPWLAVTILLATVCANGVSFLLPRQYEASVDLFVSTSPSVEQDAGQMLQGSSFAQQRVKSYAEAVTSSLVLDPVIDELELDLTAGELARKVSSEVPLDTVLFRLTVVDEDPERAALLVNEIAEAFQLAVPQLENATSADSPVTVTLLSTAEPPTDPVWPRPLLNLAVGLVLGTVAGLALILARELTDSKVRGEKDVREITGETILGGIPQVKERRAALLSGKDQPSSLHEAYRGIRSSLQMAQSGRPLRSLAITSSVRGEGKSTTAANVAITFAEGGSRVCLVDADLERPTLLKTLSLDAGAAGLTSLLRDEARLEDVLQPLAETGVFVMGTGPLPPNPTRLLSSSSISEVVERLEAAFDLVVYTVPSVVPMSDTLSLVEHVDGLAMVVGSGVVREEQLHHSLELLKKAGVRLLGLIVTRSPVRGTTLEAG